MKFTNISKFIIKFMGGGKINFPFNYLKEVEINGDNDGESGGSDENTCGFNINTFKQNIVDIYNEDPDTDTPITIDNIIMPNAFLMNDSEQDVLHFIDADLTKFLASFSLNMPVIFPLYLRDSFDENNLYFGNYKNAYKLTHRIEFDVLINFDDIPDNAYDGNLDLSNYVNLLYTGMN